MFLGIYPISNSQDSFYDYIEIGDYQIGFSDTIIYNTSLNYEQFEYNGSSPLFVQIWFPLTKGTNAPTLTYGELRQKIVPEQLKLVYNKLCTETDNSFISYNIKEEFSTYNEIEYNGYHYQDVLDTIKTYRTKSTLCKIENKLEYPVIIYHHGSQGASDENFIMAEYFASKGFIFVSSNYHLPYENEPYGLNEGVRNNTSNVKLVTTFAKTLTTNSSVFYVGHSWGAQVGWTYLNENGWADGFVSMETTIEFKSDLKEIMDKWPFVYDVVKTRKELFSLPILMFANTRNNDPFTFFSNSNYDKTIFASAKQEFGHESYTSGYLLRYFFRDQFTQPDTELVKTQVNLYREHLIIIEKFISSVIQKNSFGLEEFTNNFYINSN